jgi:hypothetical protein
MPPAAQGNIANARNIWPQLRHILDLMETYQRAADQMARRSYHGLRGLLPLVVSRRHLSAKKPRQPATGYGIEPTHNHSELIGVELEKNDTNRCHKNKCDKELSHG